MREQIAPQGRSQDSVNGGAQLDAVTRAYRGRII